MRRITWERLTGERRGRVESEAWRVRFSLRPNDRSWLKADIQSLEIEVCLYEAFAVKVVLISVACPSLSLVTPLCPGRVLR